MIKEIKLQPDNFELQTNTVWSFPNRGEWATHDAKYRGNWSPYIPRNLLLRYSKEGEVALDQFAGGGTTLVEAKLLNRNCIGIDINPYAVNYTSKKLDFYCDSKSNIKIMQGNACNLNFIKDNSIDLICTHPPYANIIHYSENIIGDLSLLSLKEFYIDIYKVANECFRILKKDKFCAILMGDIRIKGMVQPLAFETMRIFELAGLKIKEIIIKEQHNCKATGFWKTNSIKHNFLLLAHEYLFVFKK